MPTVELRLPALHAGQHAVRTPGYRYRLIRCGRRWGKTVLAAVMCIEVALGVAPWHHRCHATDGTPTPGVAWWVPPSYPVARIGWRVLRGIARTLARAGVAVEVRESDREITFPNGGRIVVRSADSPAGLRGDGIDFVVIEEAALVPARAWHEDLRPALADRQGEAMFITTPRGYNWVWELEEAAGDRWLVHHAPTSENPHIPPGEIEEMRAAMGPLEFAQEVLAEYVDDGTNPFRSDWFRYYWWVEVDGVRVVQSPDRARTWTTDQLSRFLVADLAVSTKQSADYTVVAACGVSPDGDLIVLDVARGHIPGPELVPLLRRMAERWDPLFVGLEDVGYQRTAIQHATAAGLPVRALKADTDKVTRSLPLQARMQAGTVWFPHDAPWLRDAETELVSFPSGAHDDIVDALAYAARETMRLPTYAVY